MKMEIKAIKVWKSVKYDSHNFNSPKFKLTPSRHCEWLNNVDKQFYLKFTIKILPQSGKL